MIGRDGLLAFSREVAALLPGGPWDVEEPRNEEMRVTYVSFRSAAATFNVWRGERFEVLPSWPRGSGGKYYSPYATSACSITVAATASPKRLASEIERRFLPRYLPAYENGVRAMEVDRLSEDSRDTRAAVVAAVWGVRVFRHGDGRSVSLVTPDSSAWADVTLQPGITKFSVRVDTDERARALAEFLKGLLCPVEATEC